MIGAASQRKISAKRVWRTTLKTTGRSRCDLRANKGRLFEQDTHKCHDRCTTKNGEPRQ